MEINTIHLSMLDICNTSRVTVVYLLKTYVLNHCIVKLTKNSYRIRIKSRCVMALVINGHSENLLLVSEGRNKKLYSSS